MSPRAADTGLEDKGSGCGCSEEGICSLLLSVRPRSKEQARLKKRQELGENTIFQNRNKEMNKNALRKGD